VDIKTLGMLLVLTFFLNFAVLPTVSLSQKTVTVSQLLQNQRSYEGKVIVTKGTVVKLLSNCIPRSGNS